MLVVIPTRIIPGVLAAAGFLSVGVGSGFLAAVPFLQPAKLPFSVGSTTIWTRKIRLTAPLGELSLE